MFQRFPCLVTLLLLLAIAVQAQHEAQVVLSGTWGRNPGQFAYAVDGDLSGPSSFTVDMLGNIYISDDKNNRIQQFTPEGKFVTADVVPRGESVDDIAVSLNLAPDGRNVRGRTIYTADYSGYGLNQERLLVSQVKNDTVQPLQLPVPPLMIHSIATDGRHRLFVETQGDKDPLPSVWLFDGNLRYRGHRDIGNICVQPGNDYLVGIAQRRALDEQPGTERWTVQFFSPVDMQYPLVKAVEIDVPANPHPYGPAQLIAVDRDGRLYVLARTASAPTGDTWTILRYDANGTRIGTFDLTPFWKDSLHVQQVRIGPDGAVYVATGSKDSYTIRRVGWPKAD